MVMQVSDTTATESINLAKCEYAARNSAECKYDARNLELVEDLSDPQVSRDYGPEDIIIDFDIEEQALDEVIPTKTLTTMEIEEEKIVVAVAPSDIGPRQSSMPDLELVFSGEENMVGNIMEGKVEKEVPEIFRPDPEEALADSVRADQSSVEIQLEPSSVDLPDLSVTLEATAIGEQPPIVLTEIIENKVLDLGRNETFMESTTSTVEKKGVTADVYTTNEYLFLVRVDAKEFAFANDEKCAIAIINSLANAEVKKLTAPGVRVSRTDVNDGKEARVYTQSLGLIANGRVCRHSTIDFISVPKVYITLPAPVGVPK